MCTLEAAFSPGASWLVHHHSIMSSLSKSTFRLFPERLEVKPMSLRKRTHFAIGNFIFPLLQKKFLHITDDFLQCVKALHSHADYIHVKTALFSGILYLMVIPIFLLADFLPPFSIWLFPRHVSTERNAVNKGRSWM
jgi:hypothetical protein